MDIVQSMMVLRLQWNESRNKYQKEMWGIYKYIEIKQHNLK